MTARNGPDVVLFYPKTGQDFGATVAPPHAMLSLAAPLVRRGIAVRLIDQRVEPDWQAELARALAAKPTCVGLSIMSGTQIFHALQAAAEVRRLTDGAVPLVWGGTHASILPEQTLAHPLVDIVVAGEGEETFQELLDALADKTPLDQVKGILYKNGPLPVRTEARPLLDMESLDPVPWELVNPEHYIHRDFYIKSVRRSLDIGQTSRGCPFHCGFCVSATVRQRKWRPMSAEKSLERILEPVKRFNLDAVWIRDDEFYIDRKRAYAICKGIVDSGRTFRWYSSGTRVDVFNKASDEELLMMKRSGADTLKFGAESGSNRVLGLMNKGIKAEDTIKANLRCKRLGIKPAFALMIGFPTETFDEIDQTIDLHLRLKRDNPAAEFEVISPFTAFPGTPLFDLALKHGLKPPGDLEGWIDWLVDDYDYEGRKMPWYSRAKRMQVGNIAYMSILANAAGNAVGGLEKGWLKALMSVAIPPLSALERLRLNNKWYRFCPELHAIRYVRKLMFYAAKPKA